MWQRTCGRFEIEVAMLLESLRERDSWQVLDKDRKIILKQIIREKVWFEQNSSDSE